MDIKYKGISKEDAEEIQKVDMPQYCSTCKWYAEFEGVCCNADSEWAADFRCLDDTCTEWMSREDKPCIEKT